MKLGTKQKRFLIAGIGIIAIAAFVYALTLQQEGDEGLIDNVEQKKQILRGQKEKLDLEGVYESRLQLYSTRLEENRTRFLDGDTANVAEARLLNTLTDMANRTGVQITQRSSRPEKKMDDRVVKISYRITTSCNMEQFVRLLTEIANYEQFLTIDELTVRMPTAGRGGTRGRTPQPTSTNITPVLTVSGYIQSIEAETGEVGMNTNI